MIRHIVAWKLNGTDAAARLVQAEEAAAALRTLDGLVPSVLRLEVGINSLYAEANHDLVLIADFEDAAGLDAYQVHPEHVKVAGFVKERVAARAAVDFEV